MSTTFSEVLNRQPLRTFSVITFIICMIVLVADGMDAQLLGIVAPLIIEDFGVDRGTFGFAVGAALVGFGLGSWGGGWLGDRIGRPAALAISAAVFGLGTIAASLAGDVTQLAVWRLIGGIGFGAAYSCAIALAGEWLPDRWRSVGVTTISVGTPAGGLVVGAMAPSVVDSYGWQGAFVFFGAATLILCLVLIVAFLRDSPSFLLTRGKTEAARKSLRKITDEAIELAPERHATDTAAGSVGVLDRSNLRMNVGVGITFTSAALVAYGVLNWTTTMLTAHGFTFEQASYAVAVAGLTSIFSSIAVGLLIQRYGSRAMVLWISATLVVSLLLLAWRVEVLPAMPSDGERNIVVALIGIAAAIFSMAIASNYAIMTNGYPASCRAAGIGFGIFLARVGAIASSTFGGALLDLGGDSVIPFFAVLTVAAVLVSTAAFVVDRHVPPARAKPAAAPYQMG